MTRGSAVDLIPDAVTGVTAVAERVPPQAWVNQSPCTDWSVRDVLNHLTSEHLWAPELLGGKAVEEVGDRFDGDVLGDEPVGAWKRAAAGSVMAWAQADPHRDVSVSWGTIKVREYAQQMLTDLVVHGWDLARGAGTAYDPVPDAVEAVWAYAKPMVDSGGSGMFADPVRTDSPDRLDQLVALLGRDPDWR